MPFTFSVSESGDTADSLTNEQKRLVRQIIRDECYERDRSTLLKLLGMMTVVKLVCSLAFGLLYMVYKWFL